MIEVPKYVVSELCKSLLIQEESLNFLGGGRGDSDGIVYTYQQGNQKMVLKILAFPVNEENNLDKLKMRVQYANYLGEHGIHLAYPVRNVNDHLYETVIEKESIFTAYVMKFEEGTNPKTEELTDELVREWGRLTGKSHKITKEFSKMTSNVTFGYIEEVEFFSNWCKEAVVKEEWSKMSKILSTLPITCDTYGFIHNDNHQNNILVTKNEITLIDFDCASPQFFVQDIITPAQGIMFDLTGGMMSPITDADRLKRFFDSFLSGYETENHLSDDWYGKLNTFINYRRLLLFTCMENWINTKPELKQGFLRMIQHPEKIL